MAGAAFGPVGCVVGGLVGGIAGGNVGGNFADWLATNLFNLPKEKAVEEAYRFFKVPFDASNDDINRAYKRKCLETHPDKGGDKEEFQKVQTMMQILRMHRRED